MEWELGFETNATFTVRVELVTADPTLMPTATPAIVPNVAVGDLVTTTICVDAGHAIGATLTIELWDDVANFLLGSVIVTYQAACTPVPNDATGAIIFFDVVCP